MFGAQKRSFPLLSLDERGLCRPLSLQAGGYPLDGEVAQYEDADDKP